MYGHTYKMAEAEAQGAREIEGVEVNIYRVQETVPEDILIKSGAKKLRNLLNIYLLLL